MLLISYVSIPSQAATTYYEVWRSTTNNPNTAVRIAEWLTSTCYNDDDPLLESGRHYYYWIRALSCEEAEDSIKTGLKELYGKIVCPTKATNGCLSPVQIQIEMLDWRAYLGFSEIIECAIKGDDPYVDDTIIYWEEWAYSDPDFSRRYFNKTITKDVNLREDDNDESEIYLHVWASAHTFCKINTTPNILVAIRDTSDLGPTWDHISPGGAYANRIYLSWNSTSNICSEINFNTPYAVGWTTLAPTISHIAINGPTPVNEDSSAQYTCTAYYTDSSSLDITSIAVWVQTSAYATINSTGHLTTYSVTSDQSCTIRASYQGHYDDYIITIKDVATPLPDLVITDLYPVPVPSGNTYYVSDNIDWNVTVRNNGAGPAESSDVGYYLGNSPTDISEGNRINRDSINALNGGSSDTANDSYIFVASDIGQKYLICKADYNNDVDESSEGNNTRVYGPFNVVQPTGYLNVNITPQQARDDGAQWRLTSGPDTGWKNSGQTISGITTGGYTLQFKEISSWKEPDDRSITISQGGNSQSGEYQIRPIISSLITNSGPQGSYIKIKGTDFGSTTGNIDFGGIVSDEIVSWSNTEIYCRVPDMNMTHSGSDGMAWVYTNDPGVEGHEGFTGEMSKYETTNAQYCKYLNAALTDGLIFVHNDVVYITDSNEIAFESYSANSNSQITYSNDTFSVRICDGYDMSNHPVVQVSWYGATAFCNYYGYRLPTEWEWQAVADYDGSYTYGCDTTINQSKANYYLGSGIYCNPLGLSSYPYTSPVDHYYSYGYGMNDMAGNVWEWTSTVSGSGSSRVIRGGGWGHSDPYCTVSNRGGNYPHTTSLDIGFRVCRDTIVSDKISVQVVLSGGVASESKSFTVTLPKTIYVDLVNTSGIKNGTTTYPFSTIQGGIDAASDGVEVIVASGTYYENITLKNGIELIGQGSETTTINGNANGSVVTSADCNPNTVLRGYTITSGNNSYGGGMYNFNSSPTITDCTFSDNSANSYGGGMFNAIGSSPMIINCIFSGNSSSQNGGGMYNLNSSPTIIDCTFSDNSVISYGGGVYCADNSVPTISNTILSNNGAGLYGGGIYCDFGTLVSIESCTFVNNSNGVYCYAGGNTAISNSIFWNNGDDLYDCSATYCCIENNDGGIGNIHSDPLFIDSNDYHLLPDSPCIDAGNPSLPWENEPSPNGARINMGAYGNTNEATRSRADLQFVGFNIINKTRIGRTIFQYTLSLSLENIGPTDASNITVNLIVVDNQVTNVIDDTINYGVILSGSMVDSNSLGDYFVVEIDRAEELTPGRLTWQVDYSSRMQMMSLGLSAALGEDGVVGDITGEGDVNMADLMRLAEKWLWTGTPGSADEDIAPHPDGDGIVNFLDFAIMTENWME